MSFVVDEERSVVPRWRDYRTTAATGELSGLGCARRPRSYPTHYLDHKIDEWRKSQTVGVASDVVASAFALDREEEALEAARFLLAQDASGMTDSLLGMITAILTASSGSTEMSSSRIKYLPKQNSSHELIRAIKRRLSNDPRNAIAWAELARQYAIDGVSEKASRAMHTGLLLAPSNRFILRCAARLHVHLGRPDVAHDLLRRNPATRQDPWLMAAEIAVATLARKQSRFAKIGREVASGQGFTPADLTELCSALATLDLDAGSAKKARKLFNQSLLCPTDNTVAQATWASERLNAFDMESRHLEVPRSFEARALQGYYRGEWTEAAEQCEKWSCDEPFSSRPALVGSFICQVMMQDFEGSLRFTESVLKANQDDLMLLNNQAAALASLGRVDEAELAFSRVRRHSGNSVEETVTFAATDGLLAFRRGDSALGRTRYLESIDKARRAGDRKLLLLALLHLTREELEAGSEGARSTFEVAIQAFDEHPLPELAPMMVSLKQKAKSVLPQLEAPTSGSVPKGAVSLPIVLAGIPVRVPRSTKPSE